MYGFTNHYFHIFHTLNETLRRFFILPNYLPIFCLSVDISFISVWIVDTLGPPPMSPQVMWCVIKVEKTF